MTQTPEYLTKEKYDELRKELEYLKSTRRREIAESLEYAKSLGDLAENAEYQEARAVQAALEERIGKLETMLKSVVIMESRHGGAVDVGSTVTVLRNSDGKRITYKVVGSEEADLSHGKISLIAPLGAMLLGKKTGDSFTVNTPNGAAEYKVVRVE
jgi:transcription elongation factor GreA